MKLFKAFSILAMSLALATGFTSCGDDDDEKIDVPTIKEATTAQYSYKLTVNNQFLELADITVAIVTPDGEEIKEALNDSVFKKNFTLTNFPTSISAGVTYQWKEGLDASAFDEINLQMNSVYGITILDKNGDKLETVSKSGVSINNLGVQKDKLNEIREIHLRTLNRSNQTVTFTKEGNEINYNFTNYEF